ICARRAHLRLRSPARRFFSRCRSTSSSTSSCSAPDCISCCVCCAPDPHPSAARKHNRSAARRGRFPRCPTPARGDRLQLDLVPLWAAILALGVFMYVLLDGFDLGVGILFPFAPDDRARDTMMASVAPIWDGNETWLVLGGLALLAAFPLAFA